MERQPFGKQARPFLTLGSLMVGVLLLAMAVSWLYTPYDPNAMNIAQRLSAPSWQHLMGTDEFGRDLFSRILVGTRTVLLVGGIAVLTGVAVGVLIGSFTGYLGGWVDEIGMRLVDALMALPGIVMALLIISIRGPGLANTSIALGIMMIPGIARIVRSGFIQYREYDFVLAARAVGVRPLSIMFRHIFPNQLTPLIVAASLGFASAVLGEAGLSYVGLGVQPPDPSWGRMLEEAQPYFASAPWYSLAPGVAITFTVLAFYLLSNDVQAWLSLRRRGPNDEALPDLEPGESPEPLRVGTPRLPKPAAERSVGSLPRSEGPSQAGSGAR